MTTDKHRQVRTIVPVPATVHRDIYLVRDTGVVNMLDVEGVMRVLRLLRLRTTLRWIQQDPRRYVTAIMFGLEIHDS